jgi:GNAT superfamily N-acetyltransferase
LNTFLLAGFCNVVSSEIPLDKKIEQHSWIDSVYKQFNVLARKVRRNFQDYGWWVTAKKSVSQLFKFFFYRRVYKIRAISLVEKPSSERVDVRDCDFRTLKPNDAWAIGQIEHWAEWLQDKLRDRLAAGDLCFVALRDTKVVGFNLVTFGSVFIPLLEMERTFQPGRAWLDHIAVLRDYRRKGVATALCYKVFDELRRRGIHKFYSGSLADNTAYARSAAKAGFVDVADIQLIRILSFRTWRYKRAPKQSASHFTQGFGYRRTQLALRAQEEN